MFLKWLFNRAKEVAPVVELPVKPPEPTLINASRDPDKYTLTLFLDFEGVLHFCMTEKYHYIPNLCKILDLFPYMDVVISSDWRHWAKPGEVEQIFGDYSHRITGVTTCDFGYSNRQAEIYQYVTEHGITNYIAIDDDSENRLFNPSCEWLFKTDILRGLDDDTTAQFIEFIKTRPSAC